MSDNLNAKILIAVTINPKLRYHKEPLALYEMMATLDFIESLKK